MTLIVRLVDSGDLAGHDWIVVESRQGPVALVTAEAYRCRRRLTLRDCRNAAQRL